MIRKLNLGNNWYIRFNPTILHGLEVLLGFNYCEGFYKACKDITMQDCIAFDYAEFQIGFLLFTISIGKEQIKGQYGPGNQDQEYDPSGISESSYSSKDQTGENSGDIDLSSDPNERSERRVDTVQSGNRDSVLETDSQGDTGTDGRKSHNNA